MGLPAILWSHDECGCRRAPLVGARYRRKHRDLLTGKDLGWEFYTVTEVEPLRHDRIICRRVTLVSDGGWIGHLQVQAIFDGKYQAVANVVPLR